MIRNRKLAIKRCGVLAASLSMSIWDLARSAGVTKHCQELSRIIYLQAGIFISSKLPSDVYATWIAADTFVTNTMQIPKQIAGKLYKNNMDDCSSLTLPDFCELDRKRIYNNITTKCFLA